jgi:hypothetical protein
MPRGGCGRRQWFEACKGSLETMFPESAVFQAVRYRPQPGSHGASLLRLCLALMKAQRKYTGSTSSNRG